MPLLPRSPVVHLELRTADRARERAFYTGLLGWRAEEIHVRDGDYLVLDADEGIEVGIVESDATAPSWLPYVEVDDVVRAIGHARRLGAGLVLGPRESAAGWRAILATPTGAEVALWQRKR